MSPNASIRLTPAAAPSAEPDLKPELKLDLKLDLPPLPRTVSEVLRLLSEPKDEVDAAQLVEVVDSDPVVAAAVLRRINSAFYGMRRTISSVRKSVMLLGFLEVSNLVLTTGMSRFREAFSTSARASLFDRIMEISIGAGQFAWLLAEEYDLDAEGKAYTSGLLHSVGRMILLFNRPEEYASLWASATDVLPAAARERSTFGADYLMIGAAAAEEWQLPPVLGEVIAHQTTPDALEGTAREVAALVGTATDASVQLVADADEEADVPVAEVVWSTHLRVLSEVTGADEEAILQFIEENREPVANYVTTMMVV
jgi:HD-like signal output (HDOD) protein